MKKILILFVTAAITIAMATPSIAPTNGCHPIYTPASNMPLYKSALQDVDALMGEVQAMLAEMEDPCSLEEELEAINAIISDANNGANYIYKKDLLLEAKAMLEALLA